MADHHVAVTLTDCAVFIRSSIQIGILMEDHPTEENQHLRHVEITWVGHAFPDHFAMVERWALAMGMRAQLQQQKYTGWFF